VPTAIIFRETTHVFTRILRKQQCPKTLMMAGTDVPSKDLIIAFKKHNSLYIIRTIAPYIISNVNDQSNTNPRYIINPDCRAVASIA
jgi:hypothetical protein